MTRRATKELAAAAFLAAMVATSTGIRADGETASTEPDAAAQVAAMLESNGIFAQLESLSTATSEVVISDDVFADIDAATLASLTGEEFVIDYEKGEEVPDFWNYEYGDSPNWEYQLLFNEERVILRNVTKTFSQGKELAIVGEEQILASAEEDLATLGLAVNDEDFAMRVSYLTRMSFDEWDNGTTEYMAARVKVYRKIGGALVLGPRVILGYYLDGTLQKVSMRWPRIEEQQLDPAPLTAAEQAALIEEAAAILSDIPSMKHKLLSVHAEVAWDVRDGLLQRVVVLRPPDDKDNVGPLVEVVIDI